MSSTGSKKSKQAIAAENGAVLYDAIIRKSLPRVRAALAEGASPHSFDPIDMRSMYAPHARAN